jgi:GNAT superfamily N-acetyltransferase
MTRIRRGTIADCGAAAQANLEGWRTAFEGVFSPGFLAGMSVERRTAALEARFGDPSYSMVVAENAGGSVVGFADWGRARESADIHDSELYAIYLLPSEQGKGIGRALFRSVATAVLAAGLNSLVLSVLQQNPHRGFYVRMSGVEWRRGVMELDGVPRPLIYYEWVGETLNRAAAV